MLKLSTARNLTILMTDVGDHSTGKTGLTLTVLISKNGGAFAAATPVITELAYGWYSIALTSSHTDTLGDMALHITAPQADPIDMRQEVVFALPGEAGQVAGLIAAFAS